jgi:WD40 repeat-containing protein SMU1
LTGGHDSTCREFGLLASRMLKEFRGHGSYVNCCGYVVLPLSLLGTSGGGRGDDGSGGRRDGGIHRLLAVITGSADGSVMVWDGRTAEPIREIRPPVPTSARAIVHDKDSVVGSKSVHTVAHLHSPPNTMVVVPRSDRAYLMSYAGAVLRTYARDDVQGCEFLAAAVSPSNRWLYIAADDGKCVVFDVGTGKVEKVIRSFVCGGGRSDDRPCEVSGLVCHPHRGYVGGYSNDKGQKRGILALWK